MMVVDGSVVAMGMSRSVVIPVWMGTMARTMAEVKVVRRLGLLLLHLLFLHLFFLLPLEELDDAASDLFALAFAEAALAIVRLWVLGLVEIIFSLVKDH